MSRLSSLILVLVLVTSNIAVVLPVNAESRTIVVPDDYSTVSSAIEGAVAGDTIFVKKGIYQEQSLEINKSISLIAEDVSETILILNPPLFKTGLLRNWIWIPTSAITINTNDIKLYGFSINLPDDGYGVGSGIHAVGDRISIIGNIIANRSVYLQGDMQNITGNLMPSTLEAIGSHQIIGNNTIGDNLKIQGSFNQIFANNLNSTNFFSGIQLTGSNNIVSRNSFSAMTMENSDSNFIVDNSFVRLVLDHLGNGCYNNIITNNRLTGNGNINDRMKVHSGSNNTINANSIRNCEYGLYMGSKATQNSVYLNNFYNNTEQHIVCSNLTENQFDNGVKGNYYDDYEGKDANWDGVGDYPYAIQEIHWEEELQKEVTVVYFQDNLPLTTPSDSGSVSIQLPDWASAAVDSLSESQTSEPFPITLTIMSVIAVVMAGLGLLVFSKKFQRNKKP